MRIAALVPEPSANAYYRALMPVGLLADRGHTTATAVVPGPGAFPPFAELATFDVVYFWRLYHAPIRRLARELQRRGVAIVWDNDYDLTTLPRSAPAYRQLGGMRGQREWSEMQQMIRLADVVTAPSPPLAEQYRRVGQEHVEVIENYVGTSARRDPSARLSKVTVGWTAMPEHQSDVRELDLVETFERLLEFRPDVELVSVGVALEVRSPRYRRMGAMSFQQLIEEVRRFDIGIAPLADTPFNRARSNVKVKEYASAGVPWLASDCGPYAGLGPQQGGRLVTDDAWFEAIVDLAVDADARAELSLRGHAWSQQESIDRNVHRWEAVFAEAVERARAGTPSAAG